MASRSLMEALYLQMCRMFALRTPERSCEQPLMTALVGAAGVAIVFNWDQVSLGKTARVLTRDTPARRPSGAVLRRLVARMRTVPQDRVLSRVCDGAQEKARLLAVRMFREQVEHHEQ